jgi:hypothetical protein
MARWSLVTDLSVRRTGQQASGARVTTGGRARTGSQREELVALLRLASRLPGQWVASSAAIALAPPEGPRS